MTSRRDLLSAGWTDMRISRACRDGRLTRLAPGTYATCTEPGFDDRLTALRMHVGTESVAVLATAARLHGLATPWPPDLRIHLATKPGTEHIQRRGSRLHTWGMRDEEITTVDGTPVTTVARTLMDLMCTYDRLSGVAAVDSALHAGLIDDDDVARIADATRRRRGAARCRPWWREADARAESALETRVRLLATDVGFAPHELQRRFDVPGGTAYADLAWRQGNGRWLIGEADGRSVHETPQAILRDRWRANALVGLGDVDIVRFTWADTTGIGRIGGTLAPLLRA